MKSIFMMVYNEISNDARVLRAARGLSGRFDVTLLAVGTLEETPIRFVPVENCTRIGGLRNYFRFTISAVRNGLKSHADIIYGHDIFSALPLLILRLFRRKARYVYDAHELFLPEPGKKFSSDDHLLYHWDAQVIHKCDLLVCAEENRGRIMWEHYGLKKAPLVIPNISYLRLSDRPLPDDLRRTLDQYAAIPAYSMVYAGGLLPDRRLDELVQAVDRLGRTYKLLLIGKGPSYDSLRELIVQTGNPQIMLLPAVSYHYLANVLKTADVGYMYYATDTLNNLYCAPNKICEYASIGLPILCNDNPSVRAILDHYTIGYCSDNIETALPYVQEHADEMRRNTAVFIRENSLEIQMQKLADAVEDAVLQR